MTCIVFGHRWVPGISEAECRKCPASTPYPVPKRGIFWPLW